MQPIANRKSQIANAFTLVELLVVIAIIGVLIGLLFPTIAAVRLRAQEADTSALVASLQGACERYAVDFNGAYPGPIGNGPIEAVTQNAANFPVVATVAGFAATPYVAGANRVTMSENLYLGLMGGLRIQAGTLVYDASIAGQGPSTLNPLAPARRAPYYNANADWSMKDSSGGKSGQFADLAGSADDTVIPEFVDRFGSPMPILYWRARRSVIPMVASAPGTTTDNTVVTINGVGSAPYDLNQNSAYLGSGIGEGRSLKPSDIRGSMATPSNPHGLRTVDPTRTAIDKSQVNPFDAYAYFYDRTSSATAARAKQREGFFLISAGRDRVYGTDDDIASGNFGKVGQ